MKLAILTTPDRFGLLGPSKATEAFETGVLRDIKLSQTAVVDVTSPNRIPTDTTHILILGQKALSIVQPGAALDKFRGYVTRYAGLPAVASFHPTEAHDQKSADFHENPDADEKDSAGTPPSEYFFWLRRDVEKLLSPAIKHPQLKYFVVLNLPKFISYANNYLSTTENPVVYLDIECRREDHVLNCIGLALGDSPVFVIPVYYYNNERAYEKFYLFLATLGKLLTRARVVVHNSLFDLFVLSRWYRVPFGHDVYDTMLAQHRFFPETKKSLGHTISYWCNLPYHKDLCIEHPRSANQQAQLWEYNAKDVYAMREVYKAQTAALLASNDNGLRASVDQANRAVYPYLIAMLKALPVDEVALAAARTRLDNRVSLLKRVARYLSGEANFNPGSAKQCIEFFHGKLHYEEVSRTSTGAAQMDQKALYKLRLKYNNPLLDTIIAYRVAAKEASMLRFEDYTPPNYGNQI